MRGRRVLMESLVSNGVRHIFGNPGTTETPLLDSLAAYPQIEYVMALHEGVAVGAASFYAQATGRTAVANVHVAPGLGNAMGSLYGALKANSPLIITAGQQDTRMRLANPLLGHDLVAMAAPVTKWSVQVERADEMAPVLRRAFKVATDAPKGPVFVSLPIDVMEQETAVEPAGPDKLWRSAPADPKGLAEVAALLLKSARPTIVAGDDVARAGAHRQLVALAEAIGASVWFEGLRAHASFPTGHPNYRQSLPGDAAQVRKAFGDADLVLLLGGPFFEDIWYASGSHFPDNAVVVQIEESSERLAFNHRLDAGIVGDMAASLAALAAEVRSRQSPEFRLAAQGRNQALAELSTREKDAHRSRLEKSWNREPSSMARVMAELRRGLPDRCCHRRREHHGESRSGADVRLSRLWRVFRRARRRHRPGICRRDRRQGRDARPSGRCRLRRRLGDVQYPGAVERGPPQAGNRVRRAFEPGVSHPQAQCGRLA